MSVQIASIYSVSGRVTYLVMAVGAQEVKQLLQLPMATHIKGFGYTALWLYMRREISSNLHSVSVGVEYKP